MPTLTIAQLTISLDAHLERLEVTRDQIIVTREGREPMVIVPIADWEGVEATLYLLSNPNNAAMLRESIAQLDAGQTIEIDPETMMPIG